MGLIRTFCARPLALALLAAWMVVLSGLLVPATAMAQQPEADPAPVVSLEPLKLRLDRLDEEIRDATTDEALAGLKPELDPLREQLRGLAAEVTKQLADFEARIKQVGPKPSDATTEDAKLTTERESLNKTRDAVDSALKQVRLLALRAEELDDRIGERRRDLFTQNLFRRSASIFNPATWYNVSGAVVQEFQNLVKAGQDSLEYAQRTGGRNGAIGAALSLAAILIAALLARRFGRGLHVTTATGEGRFATALIATRTLLKNALVLPLALVAIVLVLDAFGLITGPIKAIGLGLATGVAAATFGRGVALALFAPDDPEHRYMALDDRSADRLALTLTWAACIFGALIVFDAIHRTMAAPIMVTVITSAVYCILTVLVLVTFLFRGYAGLSAEEETQAERLLAWLRVALWLTVIVLVVTLAIGYIALAAFIAGRLLVAVGVFGALYIGFAFVDSLFSEVLAGDVPAGKRAAAALGLTPRGLGLLATLASAIIRIILALAALFILLGPSGFFATDFFGDLKDGSYGFSVGDFTLSFPAIIGALLILVIGILLTRAVRRWLDARFLPRTSLEPSLQNSISTIFGYVAIIAVLGIALGAVGIDLQKFALIAGALSVGIGFGLQSIVSNFVSGLILLTERPIRVGDWVVVGSEEGHVRRIAVRATEIETFDRASVLIPNQQFITEVVKNWTHANTVGRVIIKVGVSYSSDAEKVRDVLITIAEDHPLVLESPPPRALFVNFGVSSLDFELRAYIGNVDNSFMIRSDLNFAVLRKFREAGIEIPFPQRDLHIRSGLHATHADAETAVDGANKAAS